MRRGWFAVVDGLDGIGKGVVEQAVRNYIVERFGCGIFDTVGFSKGRKRMAELSDIFDIPEFRGHTVVTAEPSYAWIGRAIRDEIIKKGNNYSVEAEIQSYSLDRLVQMRRIVIPSLESGLNVLQNRCFVSTLCYQCVRAEEEGMDLYKVRAVILNHEATKLQCRYRPDLLVIPTIKDVNELVKRLEERDKKDNSRFENAEFQGKLKPHYGSSWLKDFFENYGTRVAYLDAGISEEDTRRQTVEIFSAFLDGKSFKEEYQNP